MTSRIGRAFALILRAASTAVVMVLAVLLTGLSAQASEAWLTDYDEALAESTRSGKPVLTLFTGSDW